MNELSMYDLHHQMRLIQIHLLFLISLLKVKSFNPLTACSFKIILVNEEDSSSDSSNFSPKVTQVVNERSSGSSSSSLRLPCLHEKERIADCHKKQKTTTRTSANLASSKLTTGQAGISFGDQESEFVLDRPFRSRMKI